MQNRTLNIEKIQLYLREFCQARDWDQFHTPKNLSMALVGEAAELLELFQWLTPEESQSIMKKEKTASAVKHELADILYHLARLADVLDVDLESSFWEKQKLNAEKYPVEQAKGSAKKYTEF